ncbi:hypothetical protein [Vibrio sp.]|uniref:hypothetical protein n=1 Tax=Vibrio sp. TaxID=678 RepID=UPI003F6D603E
MNKLSLVNDKMIITLPFASKFLAVFNDGSTRQFEVNKYYYPLCQKALNLDHKALLPEILNFAFLEEVVLIIADYDNPYSFIGSLRRLQSSAEKFGGITNPQATLRYFEELESIELSAARKVNLIKLCNLLQSDLDYATLSLTIKNDEIMNRLSMSSRSLISAFKILKDLRFIDIKNRNFKRFSLPQRITFSVRFFEDLLIMSQDEVEQVHQQAIKHINEMVFREYIVSRLDDKIDNKHYLAIAKLLEEYESTPEDQDESKKQMAQKIDVASQEFSRRKKQLIQRGKTKKEDEETSQVPYSKEGLLEAYDTVEEAMQRTKEKAKNLMLSLDELGIKDPRVIKAIANLL